jgi:hypothetical protein
MKIKTADLTGHALDWAVAKAEGHETVVSEGGFLVMIRRHNVVDYFDPSGNWGWGGPIIEREGIWLMPSCAAYWEAQKAETVQTGSTPLIAAMRCFVASKLGDVVDVPDELVQP